MRVVIDHNAAATAYAAARPAPRACPVGAATRASSWYVHCGLLAGLLADSSTGADSSEASTDASTFMDASTAPATGATASTDADGNTTAST